jgi:hypothetical protein
MTDWARDRAVARVEEILETIETEEMPVPVREVWVYGDVALGLDPVERVHVYLTKDLLFHDEPDRAEEFLERHGVQGVGKTVRAAWAEEHPHHLRANASGHVAPEQCLAAHLLEDGEPIHLEVCNTSFDDNVRQRLEGAMARDAYTEILDPRGACLWVDGQRSETALAKLRAGEFVFPPLARALAMLGMADDEAAAAADTIESARESQDGTTVRGDVV